MALTTTILNSSPISPMKEEICFISRSTLPSLPVFNRVVMASVAMLRLLSLTRFSISSLHLLTTTGWRTATSLRVRMAAKRRTGLVAGDEQLHDVDSRRDLRAGHAGQVADGACRLEDDHVVLVSQAVLQK